MKIVKRVAIGLGVVVALFVVIGFLLPGTYHVERSVVVNGPADAIYTHISTLRHWPEWTAWTLKKYPDMKIDFKGPEDTVGAQYTWTGEQSGAGKLTLTSADPNKGIGYDLDFENGQYLSTGMIVLEPTGEQVKVTWSNDGNLGMNPVNRYFGLLMDSFMGPDFEEGLSNLKRRVEAEKAAPPAAGSPNEAATPDNG